MRKRTKQFISFLLSIVLMLGMIPMTVFAASYSYTAGAFTITSSEPLTEGTDYSCQNYSDSLREYNYNILTINTEKPITIKNTNSAQTHDSIIVEDGVSANITLAGVNISTYVNEFLTTFYPALQIAEGSTGNVTITLADGTTNTLIGGYQKAGLQKNGGTGTLTIQGDSLGTGTLYAEGGGYGAGIGGAYQCEGTNITINRAVVTAQGGLYGAGIGGGGSDSGISGQYGKASKITITDSVVTATGGEQGAGIGGGNYGSLSLLHISGGSVKAIAGTGASTLGGGAQISSGVRYTHPTDDGTGTGHRLYLLTIDNPTGATVKIDGTDYGLKQHGSDDTNLYVYLTGTEHTVYTTKTLKYALEDKENVNAPELISTHTHVDSDGNDICDECFAATKTIRFDKNNDISDSVTMKNIVLDASESSYSLPECAFTTPEGKYFKGWSTVATGEIITDNTITVSESMTLYAIWGNLYSITFHANGGSGTVDTEIVKEGTTYTLPSCTFTPPTDHYWLGWATSGTGNVITAETIAVNENIDLYAIWGTMPLDGQKTVLDVSKGSIVIGADSLDAYASDGTHLTEPDYDGYIITGTSTSTEWNSRVEVKITGGSHKIILRDLSIDVSSLNYAVAFMIKDAQVELTLEGSNSLASGSGYAALNLEGTTATLTITSGSTGSLTADGGKNAAGIGPTNGKNCGDITIAGGKISIVDDNDSKTADIGVGDSGTCGIITISGGLFAAGNATQNTVYGIAVAECCTVTDLGEGYVYRYQVVADEIITLSSIAVTTAPTKTVYTAGEDFDITGMVVTATYSNNTSAPVTGYTVTDGNALTAGKTTVTISYTEGDVTKTTTQAITVNKIVPTIAFKNAAVSKTYDGNTFALPVADDLTITGAEYSDVVFTWTAKEGSSLTNGNPVNAGGYTLTATIPATDDREEASVQKDYRINKAQISDTVYNQKVMNTSLVEQRISLPALPDGASYVFSKLYLGDEVEISDHFTKLEMDGTDLVYSGKDSMTVGKIYDVLITVVGENHTGTIDIEMVVIAHTHGNGTLHRGTPADCATETNGEKGYYICSCGQKFYDADCTQPVTDDADLVIPWAHTGGEANCMNGKICSVCSKEYTAKNADDHAETAEWTQTATTHKKAYTCCGVVVVEEEAHEWNDGVCSECGYGCSHTGGTATCTDKAVCVACGNAYGNLDSENHTGDAEWIRTATTHKKDYSCCGGVVVAEEAHEWNDGVCSECGYGCSHTGGTATCTNKAVCVNCGNAYGELNEDNHASSDYTYISNDNGTHHKSHKCCGVEVAASEACTYGNDNACDYCGYAKEIPTEDTKITVEGVTEENIPQEIKDRGFDTPEKILDELFSVITDAGVPVADGNMVLHEVTLKISFDGGNTWTNATEENFPKEGLTVVLPYPAGTNKNNFDFTVAHMFSMTSARLGTIAGDVELPTVAKLDSGIQVTLKGLSPVLITWTEIPATDEDEFDWDAWYYYMMMLHNQQFTIESSATEGGIITPASITKVKYDKSQTYEIVPLEGYEIVSVFVDGKDIGAVTEYTFKRVKEPHTIYAVFVEIPWQNPFTDVSENDWFYEDVKFVNENGLMIGTDLNLGLFSPEYTLNRATIVMTLWRLAGKPIADTDITFDDLENDWYTAAMKWAISEGIILGYGDGTCRPLAEITHEQVVAIFHRFAKYMDTDDDIVTPMIPQCNYSEWAENDVLWAITNNLFDGFGSDVSDLTKTANRAEIAAYLRRLCELIEE